MKKTILFFVGFVFLFSFIGIASATDYYVSLSGVDANNGSSGSPWLTIQHAINTVAITEDTINVAAGIYTEQLTIIDKSLNLIGAGESTTTIKAPTSGRSTVSQPSAGYSDIVWDYVVAAYSSSGTIDVKIEGFTIDANGQEGNSSQNFAGVFFRDVGDGVNDGLYACTIYNFGSYGANPNSWSGTYGTWMGNCGVMIYDDSELTIDDCDINDYTIAGINARGTEVNLAITSNDLDGTDSDLDGIFLRDGVATISGNNIHGHDGVGENIGIYLYEAKSGVVLDDSAGPNIIQDNFIGVWLKGTSAAIIDGNTFTDNSYKSIIADQDSDNNVIKSNTITMTGLSVLSAINIGTDSGGNVIGGATAVDGNTITIPTNTGEAAYMPYVIYLTSGTGDTSIQNNMIHNGARAIQIDGGNTGTYTISDNTITNDGTNSIHMNYGIGVNAGNIIVTDNTMIGTGRPLECFGAGTITFTENTISGSNYFGLNLGSYSSNPIVTGNSFLEFGGNGNVVRNQGSGAVDATRNWWGDTDPSDNVNNEGSGSIDYNPWYTNKECTEFGPVMLTAISDGTKTGYTTIQAAIDAAEEGDTIDVAAGTYTEVIIINKSLTLLGATYDLNKNGYTVPASYAWDDTVESIINHPSPGTGHSAVAIVDIYDVSNVTFKGFVVQELNAVGNVDDSLVRVRAQTQAISNIVVENNIIGPFTNMVFQDGAQGRMGLYIVNNPYSDQYGVVDSSFSAVSPNEF